MSILGAIGEALGILARFAGLKPGPDFKRLKGPAHVFPPPGSVLETYYGRNRCMYCDRIDPDQTPLTDPPCPRDRGRDQTELA